MQKIINSAGNSIIGKLVKFEGDTFEASKDIPVAPLSNEILQAFVRGDGEGGGVVPTYKLDHTHIFTSTDEVYSIYQETRTLTA